MDHPTDDPVEFVPGLYRHHGGDDLYRAFAIVRGHYTRRPLVLYSPDCDDESARVFSVMPLASVWDGCSYEDDCWNDELDGVQRFALVRAYRNTKGVW